MASELKALVHITIEDRYIHKNISWTTISWTINEVTKIKILKITKQRKERTFSGIINY